MFFVEASDGVMHEPALFLRFVDLRVRRGHYRLGNVRANLIAAEEAPATPLALLEGVEGKVHRNAHQVRLERALFAEITECAMKANERFLSDVVCIISATEHPDDCRGDDGFVPLHDASKRIV